MVAFDLARPDRAAPELAGRVRALVALYRHIASTRMAGLPLCNAALAVQAVGFDVLPGSGGALGVLVTPWFINLVWLPVGEPLRDEHGQVLPPLRVGDSRTRAVGDERFDFIGAWEDGFGPYEACSLFSPVFEFADQASAVATAEAVLSLLRTVAAPPAPAALPPQPQHPPVPARRRFLLGGAGPHAAGPQP